MKNDKGEEVYKPKDQYTSVNWNKLTKNSRAKHILYCGLDATNIIKSLPMIQLNKFGTN